MNKTIYHYWLKLNQIWYKYVNNPLYDLKWNIKFWYRKTFHPTEQERWEKMMVKTFPELYKHRAIMSPFECDGFAIGKGWRDLVYDLSKEITDYCRGGGVKFPTVLQVKEKFGCYDSETEVLTKNGWKYFKDVTYDDTIATLKNGEYLEYNKPTDIIQYHYNGKMYSLKNTKLDILVTPNHNLYISKGNYYNGRHKPPKKVVYDYELATPDKYFGKKKRFKKSCTWNGLDQEYFHLPEFKYENVFGFDNDKNVYKNTKRTYIKEERKFLMIDWAEFLGFYVAEGCSSKTKGEIGIAYCNVDNGEELEYIKNLVDKLGLKYSITMSERSAGVLKIYNKQLNLWLLEQCGHTAKNKKVPNFIKELSPKYIEKFLIGLYNGDGCKTKTAHILTTISKQLADDVQELILKIGCSSSVHKRKHLGKPSKAKNGSPIISKHLQYGINWMKYCKDCDDNRKSAEDWIDYDDMVYCITVPNNIIMVRRNYKHYWCGNSLRFYIGGGDVSINKYIDDAEKASFEICEYCGSRDDVKQTQGRWIKTLCKECREKK